MMSLLAATWSSSPPYHFPRAEEDTFDIPDKIRYNAQLERFVRALDSKRE